MSSEAHVLNPQVRMVTGDNLKTAKAIAIECGILGSESDATEHTIIEGKVFREFSEEVRERVAQEITVCPQLCEFPRSCVLTIYSNEAYVSFSS